MTVSGETERIPLPIAEGGERNGSARTWQITAYAVVAVASFLTGRFVSPGELEALRNEIVPKLEELVEKFHDHEKSAAHAVADSRMRELERRITHIEDCMEELEEKVK